MGMNRIHSTVLEYNPYQDALSYDVPDDHEGDRAGETLFSPTTRSQCSRCHGDGHTSQHVDMPGGGFTQREWDQQSPEFRDHYLRGDDDKPCDCCDGDGYIIQWDRRASPPEAGLILLSAGGAYLLVVFGFILLIPGIWGAVAFAAFFITW